MSLHSFVGQACISVQLVYGLVQSPSICPKDLGKSVVTSNFGFVAGEGTGPSAELRQRQVDILNPHVRRRH